MVDYLLILFCVLFSPADAVDTPPAGRRPFAVQRDPGVFHRGAPYLTQLLDPRGRPHDPRVEEVPYGEHRQQPLLQDAHEADHRQHTELRLWHLQVRGEEPERRVGRDHQIV